MRWVIEHPLTHFHYVDPNAPWYGKFLRFWTNKCPYCKCLDLWNHGHNPQRVLANGKVVYEGAIECQACRRRWDWDTNDR